MLRRLFGSKERKEIGGYRLIERVAEGGMAVIYKAEDRSQNMLVALKALKPAAFEKTQQQEAHLGSGSEGEIAIKLDHPNLVHTYEYGRQEDIYFLAMELLEPFTLKFLIYAHSPMVAANRFDLIMDLAQGVSYLHEQGLIHRDLTPQNVLFTRDGVSKLIDFGLTVHLDAVEGRRDLRSGTPSYMAPEQIRGKDIDQRADIYSFGVTMYEILASRLPYTGDSGFSRRGRHLSQTPTPLRRFAPSVSPEIEQIVMKSIEKEPDKRFQSMEELIGLLSVFTRKERKAPERDELRRFPRTDDECLLKYRTSSALFFLPKNRALTSNLSADGFQSPQKRELDVGAQMRVQLYLRGATVPIEALARVIWAKRDPATGKFDTGFRFVEMSTQDRQKVVRFIQSR